MVTMGSKFSVYFMSNFHNRFYIILRLLQYGLDIMSQTVKESAGKCETNYFLAMPNLKNQ